MSTIPTVPLTCGNVVMRCDVSQFASRQFAMFHVVSGRSADLLRTVRNLARGHSSTAVGAGA